MRPGGVVAVAVLMALSGVTAVISSVPPVGVSGAPPWAIALDVLVGLAMLYVAWGLFVLRSWAWVVTLGIQAINGLFAIVAIVNTPRTVAPWIALAIAGVVIVYLTRPRVRMAFAIASPMP